MWAIRFSLHHFSRVFLETPNSFAAAAVEYKLRMTGIHQTLCVEFGCLPWVFPGIDRAAGPLSNVSRLALLIRRDSPCLRRQHGLQRTATIPRSG